MPLDAQTLRAALRASAFQTDDVAPRLAAIADELSSLAGELERTRGAPRFGRAVPSGAERAGADHADSLLALGLAAIQRRTLRNRQFRPALFADPAWDMLLDLFVSRLRRRPVCVSSLCIAARVPATTALRWIRNMEAHGEIVRKRDPHDGRRVFIQISDAAFDAVARTLTACVTGRDDRIA